VDDDLRDLWDDADDAVEAARRTLNRFDQTLFACSEEAAEAGADLLNCWPVWATCGISTGMRMRRWP